MISIFRSLCEFQHRENAICLIHVIKPLTPISKHILTHNVIPQSFE